MISSVKNSILLPGSFFDDQWETKIEMIQDKIICNTIYLFDHRTNPLNKTFTVYKQFEAINKLLVHDPNLRLGTLVTNISKQDDRVLVQELNEIFRITSSFDFGIGLGDNRYEKSVRKDNASIEQAINKLIETFNFDKEGRSIFIGGFSAYTQYLANRFGLGMNLWKKDPKHLGKLVSSKNDNNKGRNSITIRPSIEIPEQKHNSLLDEVIYIIKDSTLDEFSDQLDSIK